VGITGTAFQRAERMFRQRGQDAPPRIAASNAPAGQR
jgi:hypothetical protein